MISHLFLKADYSYDLTSSISHKYNKITDKTVSETRDDVVNNIDSNSKPFEKATYDTSNEQYSLK